MGTGATGARGWRAVAAGMAVVVGLGATAAGCGGDGGEDDGASDRGLSSSGGRGGGEEAAAGDAGDEACDVVGGSSAEADTSVEVAMREYAVTAAPEQVPAGRVELVTANDGRIWHELMVVRVDGDPGALALDQFGGADETVIPEEDVVGKIREFLAGTTCRATFDLAPGRYALICNLVDDGSNPHYSQGMYAALTVT
jgi:hypothetical protein